MVKKPKLLKNSKQAVKIQTIKNKNQTKTLTWNKLYRKTLLHSRILTQMKNLKIKMVFKMFKLSMSNPQTLLKSQMIWEKKPLQRRLPKTSKEQMQKKKSLNRKKPQNHLYNQLLFKVVHPSKRKRKSFNSSKSSHLPIHHSSPQLLHRHKRFRQHSSVRRILKADFTRNQEQGRKSKYLKRGNNQMQLHTPNRQRHRKQHNKLVTTSLNNLSSR